MRPLTHRDLVAWSAFCVLLVLIAWGVSLYMIHIKMGGFAKIEELAQTVPSVAVMFAKFLCGLCEAMFLLCLATLALLCVFAKQQAKRKLQQDQEH